jgi:ribosome-binding factor A
MREELALAIGGLSDPRIVGTLVTRVEVTDDLQTAKVYVRHQRGAVDAGGQRAMLRALENASGKLRHDVSQALALRYSPKLKFFYDEGQDAASRVEELLREIERGE